MSRSKELKNQHRKAIFGALVVAAAVHALVFVVNPSFFIPAPEKAVVRSRLDLFFHRPEVLAVDGIADPAKDSLMSFRVDLQKARVALIKDWPSVYRAYGVGGSVSLRLEVDSIGRVVAASLVESSGDLKKDEAFEEMARSFRYRWTPIEAVSEGVLLIQPLSIEEAAIPLQIRMDSIEAEARD